MLALTFKIPLKPLSYITVFFKKETSAPLSIVRQIYFKPPNRTLVQAITHTAHIFFASKLLGGFQGSDAHHPVPWHCCGSLEELRKSKHYQVQYSLLCIQINAIHLCVQLV